MSSSLLCIYILFFLCHVRVTSVYRFTATIFDGMQLQRLNLPFLFYLRQYRVISKHEDISRRILYRTTTSDVM